MTTVVSVAQGGTGSNSASAARTALGAAPSAAYDAANNAYAAANTGNLLAGGVITGTLNVTQDIIVGGNVYLEGNTTFINVATYSIEDSLMYLASNNSLTDSVDIGFIGGKNTSGTFSHTGLARDATDGKYKLFDGLPDNDHVGNVVNFANSYLATLVANVEANTLSVVNGVSGNVNFDSGTLFVDSVNNRVGVGTTTPESNFDVSATGQVTSTIRSMSTGGARDAILRLNILSTGGDDPAGNIKFTVGNSYTDVASIQAVYNPNRLLFYTGTTERLRIDSFGRIGVGTTDPTAELHIYKSTGPTINLQAGSSGTKGLKIIKGDSGTAYINNIDAQDLVLATNNTNRVIIAGEGFVGINTSTISERLTVTGNIKLTTGSIVYVENPAGGRTGALFTDSTGTELRSHNGAGEPLTLNAPDSTAYMAFRTAGGERARILSGGNVGIGTTSPAAKFQVSDSSTPHIRSHFSGAAAAGNKGALIFSHNRNSDGTQETLGYIQGVAEDNQSAGGIRFVARNNTDVETFRITSAGNVGIGTTNPQGKLTVSNSGAEGIEFFTTGGVGGGPYFNAYNRSAGRYVPFTYYANTHTFYTNTGSTRVLDLTTAGNIGIGTASTDYAKVHIREGGITAAAISTGWPAYNAETATQSKYVLHLDAGGNGSSSSSGQGPSAVLLIGNYYDSRGIITMLGAGGGSPSDGGTGYGKDLMVKAGNSDNGNGYVGGRLFLAGGSGYSGGAFGSNYGSIIMQSQGGNVGIGITNPNSFYKLDMNGPIQANGTMVLSGDGGAGYVGSRVVLRTHNNYRGAGMYLVGETSAVSNNTFYIGTPYTDHSYGLLFRYTANNYQTDYQSAAYTAAGTTLMWLAPSGAVNIPGSLSKGSGSFKIDHPLPEKANSHFLVHSFIEGPQADLIYRGRANLINGIATVNIDTAAGMTEGTFVLLCRDVQCFTSNETDWDAVRGFVTGNILTIQCQNPESNATIAWMVIGERQDKHMYDTEWTDEIGKVIVEPEKPAIITPEEPNVA